ncbi:hypothetical protein H5410_045967 [Solanum commersonii]|uniref:Uncharacterized protein n=1 Tax=Solanum commersonii TaxID=4109 RepID=A0A9J5XD25_SOLCO|nr:hypothetical protein H5410_045967 [Solanum commersonii]
MDLIAKLSHPYIVEYKDYLVEKVLQIVIPELHEMRIGHIVSIGSESLCTLNPNCGGGYTISIGSNFKSSLLSVFFFFFFVTRKGAILTYDTRTDLAFFHSFTATEYVAAQLLRNMVASEMTENIR